MSSARVIPPDELAAASRALISARRTNLGVEVQMPVIYPTGESVTVVVTVQGGEYLVHDAGFGAMYLTSSGVSLNQTLRARLAQLAIQYGCDFIDGRMSRRCSAEQVALAMVMVANASRTVGDQAIEARKRPIASFKRELIDLVTDMYGARVRPDEEVRGTYGTLYRVNAAILDSGQTSVVTFIEAVADESSVNRHFREFWDLSKSPIYENVTRLAVYDSRRNWREGDLSILQTVSKIVPYLNAQMELATAA